MLAAAPAWKSVRPSPDSASVHLLAMLPTTVTSSPSRIQVIPNAMTTNQCHRAHGNRSILAGTRLSTVPLAPPAVPTLPYCLLSVRPPQPPDRYARSPTEDPLSPFHKPLNHLAASVNLEAQVFEWPRSPVLRVREVRSWQAPLRITCSEQR